MRNNLSITSSNVVKLHYNSIHTINQLDIWDSRFINSCLVGSNQGVMFAREKMYPVDIHKYAELSGLYYGEAFDKALKAAIKLRDFKFSMVLPNGATLHDQLVYKIIEDKDMQLFLIHWNENFIPLVSGHMKAGDFISPQVSAASFSSNRRYCLYLALIKQLYLLEKQDSFIIPKQEIRSILGLKEGEYSEFKMVNAKVIKPALRDIYAKLGIPITCKIHSSRVIFQYGEVK